MILGVCKSDRDWVGAQVEQCGRGRERDTFAGAHIRVASALVVLLTH